MGFTYARTVRFHETDAAGVVYFANVLTLCHEAYEAALGGADINLKQFFSVAGETAVPVVHAQVDFSRPLFCGDAIAITLTPKQISPTSFEISYVITTADQSTTDQTITNQTTTDQSITTPSESLAKALTRHTCISVQSRRRHPLTPELLAWIEIAGQ